MNARRFRVWDVILVLIAAAAVTMGILADSQPEASGRSQGISLRLSGMDGGLALRVADGAGNAIPVRRIRAHAALVRDRQGIVILPMSEMNCDHLMANVQGAAAGALVVTATIDGQRYRGRFDLPVNAVSSVTAQKEPGHEGQ